MSEPDPPPPPGSGTYEHLSEQSVAVGPPYRAFGGMTNLAGDDLEILMRSATNHDVDGKLVRFLFDGATWTGPTDVLDDARDLRDCEIATLATGARLGSFTARTNSGAAVDFVPWSMRSAGPNTWDSPVQITHGFTDYGFISAKIVELANGDLIAPLYGQSSGAAAHARLSISTDDAASWADLGVLAQGGGRSWEEPQVARFPDGRLVAALRSDTGGTPTIHLAWSHEDDPTDWTTPVALFAGSGRPSIHVTAEGHLAIHYRHTGAGFGVPAVRFSYDEGDTWTAHEQLNSGGNMAYGSWVTTSVGRLGLMWSVEQSGTRCDIGYDLWDFVPA